MQTYVSKNAAVRGAKKIGIDDPVITQLESGKWAALRKDCAPKAERQTIRSVATTALLEGGSPEEALQKVLNAFPGCKCNVHWVRWLANRIDGTPGKRFARSEPVNTEQVAA